MADELYNKLKQFGSIKANELMSKHTTLRIGGPADYFLIIESVDSIVSALRYLDETGVSYAVIGGGSNLLVRDEGFRGVVIEVCDRLYMINDTVIEAAAGCITAEIAQLSIKECLTGFEWGIGIPGTIGGAVRGNAGAAGGDMKGVVSWVEMYKDGEITKVSNSDCNFGYRDSVFKRNAGVILRVGLFLKKGENAEAKKKALENMQYRIKTQPQGQSAGCVFKNFKSDGGGLLSSGKLIDESGMKGASVGGAEVSTKHCNFILNRGNATANDVLSLIDMIKEAVYNKFEINLEEEIQII